MKRVYRRLKNSFDSARLSPLVQPKPAKVQDSPPGPQGSHASLSSEVAPTSQTERTASVHAGTSGTTGSPPRSQISQVDPQRGGVAMADLGPAPSLSTLYSTLTLKAKGGNSHEWSSAVESPVLVRYLATAGRLAVHAGVNIETSRLGSVFVLQRPPSLQASPQRKECDPFVIALAGGTASGKTTVCNLIMQRLHDQCVALIPQDSFYKDLSPDEHNAAARGGACPFKCPHKAAGAQESKSRISGRYLSPRVVKDMFEFKCYQARALCHAGSWHPWQVLWTCRLQF
jgi:hypothetical protein